MTQTDVLDYIRKTPHNSNVNVVKGMLNTDDSGGSSIVHPVQVTIVNNTENTVYFTPLISNDDPESGYSGGFYISDYGITTADSGWIPTLSKNTTTVLPPAYCLDDGVIYITDITGEHYTYTLSENATKTEILQGMDTIVVTGDCTIIVA